MKGDFDGYDAYLNSMAENDYDKHSAPATPPASHDATALEIAEIRKWMHTPNRDSEQHWLEAVTHITALLDALTAANERIKLVDAELSKLRDSLEQDWIDYDSAPPPQDPTASMLYAERQKMLKDYAAYVEKIRAHLAGGTP